MAFGTRTVAGGTTGALADAPVAVDTVSSADYQRIKKVDPTEGSTTAIGIETNPEKVKPVRRGSSDYDSGLVSVTNGAPASVTASTIYPEGGTVANTATSARKLTLTTAADGSIAVMTLAPESFVPLPVPTSGAWAGLKAGADGAGVVLHVAGRQ